MSSSRAAEESPRGDSEAAFEHQHFRPVPGRFSGDPAVVNDPNRIEDVKLPVYMDNHATTAVDPRVFEVMKPYFCEIFGNAASRHHSFGWRAQEGVEKGRKQVAALIGAAAKDIIFTSGATESNNLALKGVARAGNHMVTVATEHKAILDTCKRLEAAGVEVTYLPVGGDGLIDL